MRITCKQYASFRGFKTERFVQHCAAANKVQSLPGVVQIIAATGAGHRWYELELDAPTEILYNEFLTSKNN